MLYEKTKYNKNSKNIDEYKKAIFEYAKMPYEYITNIEYIISSSIGLNSFKEFMDKNIIPICAYDYLIEKFNACIDKCKKANLNSSVYEEYMNEIKKMKDNNIRLYTMYEFYHKEENDKKYLETFYGITDDIPNCKNVDGMVKTFNEQAIPDMINIAKSIGNSKTMSILLNYIKEQSRFKDPYFYEWMNFVLEDYKFIKNDLSYKYFKENSLHAITDKILLNKDRLFKEALLSEEKNISIKYNNKEIDAMQNMIAYNEFMYLYADEVFKENANEIKKSLLKQNNSLYEELIAMEDVSFLDDIDEATIFNKHIQHKKTGNVPDYLSDVYGASDTYEDDSKPTPSVKNYEDDDEDEDDIDSYRRPSSLSNKPIKKNISLSSSDDDNDNHVDKNLGNALKNTLTNDKSSSASNVYNTYYYNYTNSYNRNSNSYNKHDIDTKVSDQSLKINNKANDKLKESSLADLEPWNLDNVLNDKIFVENIFTNENSNICKLWHLPEKVSDEIKRINTFLIESIYHDIHTNDYNDIDKIKLERYFDLITSKGYLFEMGDTAILENNKNILGKVIILPNVNEEFNFHKTYTCESTLGNRLKSKFKVTRINTSDESNIKFVETVNNIINNAISKYYAENNSNDNNINLEAIGSKYNVNYIIGSFSESYCFKILRYLREDEQEDPDMPQSDHPIRDTLIDVDQKLSSYQQSLKHGTQNVINVGKAIAKPFKRIGSWLGGLVDFWKDKDEEELKKDLADPENRYTLYKAARTGIHYWALGYAGLLLNPIFLYLQASKLWTRTANRDRIRNEMINEINTELQIIDEKIEYAKEHNDLKNQFKLMRYKDQIRKKLIKVAGGKYSNYII